MKTFYFYFVAFFFLYLMCIFTLGVSGAVDFLNVFSIAYLVSMLLFYPFFLMVHKIFSQSV